MPCCRLCRAALLSERHPKDASRSGSRCDVSEWAKEDADASTLHDATRCRTLPPISAAGTEPAGGWPRGGLCLRSLVLSHGGSDGLSLLPRWVRLARLKPRPGVCACAGGGRPACDPVFPACRHLCQVSASAHDRRSPIPGPFLVPRCPRARPDGVCRVYGGRVSGYPPCHLWATL